MLDAIGEHSLDANVSVKPTAVGLKLGYNLGKANVEALVRHAAESGNFVRIDMEDSSTTDDTLRMYRELRGGLDNVGVVLQARLRRTLDDIAALRTCAERPDLQGHLPGARSPHGLRRDPGELRPLFEALVETARTSGSRRTTSS